MLVVGYTVREAKENVWLRLSRRSFVCCGMPMPSKAWLLVISTLLQDVLKRIVLWLRLYKWIDVHSDSYHSWTKNKGAQNVLVTSFLCVVLSELRKVMTCMRWSLLWGFCQRFKRLHGDKLEGPLAESSFSICVFFHPVCIWMQSGQIRTEAFAFLLYETHKNLFGGVRQFRIIC